MWLDRCVGSLDRSGLVRKGVLGCPSKNGATAWPSARPAAVDEALGLHEGDEIEVRIAGTRTLEIARAVSPDQREAALARMRETRWKLPPDWKFDRDDANSR